MQEFLIGLCFGVVGLLAVWIWQVTLRRDALKKTALEITRLKSLLADRMDIESDGIKQLKAENETLRTANENLRITNAALTQKPGRAEARQLMIYQQTVDKLVISTPGFGAAWQSALNESEAEYEHAVSGGRALFKKMIPSKSVSRIGGSGDDPS